MSSLVFYTEGGVNLSFMNFVKHLIPKGKQTYFYLTWSLAMLSSTVLSIAIFFNVKKVKMFPIDHNIMDLIR